ncbi:MAG: glucose 1-dehydrogenase [Pseudomonadota bacterium]
MGRVSGKIAIVTGAASGIGKAIAGLLAREGADVVMTDLDARAGRAAAETMGAIFMPQDVTDEARWQEVVAKVERRFGALHILVNNAGIGDAQGGVSPEDTSLADWRRVQEVNVEGVFLGCKAAIPAMRRASGGSIVNMSSIAALVATPFITAYGASKAAVRQLTMSVALHCAQTGSRIRCNSVHPGQVLTPMLEGLFHAHGESEGIGFEAAKAAFRARIPLGEFAVPEDIAHGVLYLASDEARHVTGAQLVIDGGMRIA